MSGQDEFEKWVLDVDRQATSLGRARHEELFARINAAAALGVVPTVPLDQIPELPAAVALGQAGAAGAAGGAASGAAAGTSIRLLWLSAGLTLGGALGWGAGYLTFSAAQEPRPASVSQVAPADDSAAPVAVGDSKMDAGVQESPVALESPAVLEPPPAEKSLASPSLQLQAGASPKVSEEAPAPRESSFYEEMSYLRRAQSALRDGKPAMALGLMLSLDEMNTPGALLPERGVTKVLSLCQLGRQQEAKRIAARVLSQQPGAVYATRLQNTCAKD